MLSIVIYDCRELKLLATHHTVELKFLMSFLTVNNVGLVCTYIVTILLFLQFQVTLSWWGVELEALVFVYDPDRQAGQM